MKKSLFFIVLFGVLLMFFIFPVVSIATGNVAPLIGNCSIASGNQLTCNFYHSPPAPHCYPFRDFYPVFGFRYTYSDGGCTDMYAEGGGTVNLDTEFNIDVVDGDIFSYLVGYTETEYTGTGTISFPASGVPALITVIGSGTQFLTELTRGIYVSFGWVQNIISNTEMVVFVNSSSLHENTPFIYYAIDGYASVKKNTTGDWTLLTTTSNVSITTPTTGSTITNDTTELVGTWANLDSDIWTNIKLAFNDLQIGETSKIVNIPITDDNGDFSITLSDFDITKNGDWTLRTIVENAYDYNFDIETPTYYLTFDIEGLPTPYAFTDFEDWYTANVPNYETPSDWASAIIGFLQPIFEKIGEYGNRIENYLNIFDAYDKGFAIGGVFPVVIAYVEKIDLFFGGFPIVQFFKWLIIAMIGIFVVKAILKLLSFIPFIGGSG